MCITTCVYYLHFMQKESKIFYHPNKCLFGKEDMSNTIKQISRISRII